MGAKRFLHIMPDDKFLDYFIEQSEQVAPEASTYWIKLNNTKTPTYVKSKLVNAFQWNCKRIEDLIEEGNQFERIILHSFSLNMAEFILKLKPSLPIVWVFWGFEGYNYTSNNRRWLLPATVSLQKKILLKNVDSIRGLFKRIELRYVNVRDSITTRNIIRRINCCATWVKNDYQMINHVNPSMVWFDYSYYTIKQLGLDYIKPQENDYSNVWIGNSGASTNNHADALLDLKESGWQGSIYMPLSYGGSSIYKEEIIKLGKELFNTRFHPIIEFMPLSDYQKLINKCGIVWMNHIRQQAAGNVLAALYLGKAVILNAESNLYKTLNSWGVTLCTGYQNFDFNVTNTELIKLNRHIIEKQMSFEHALKCIERIYCFDI